MSTAEAEARASELMRGHEPGDPEWSEAVAILMQAMRDRQREQTDSKRQPPPVEACGHLPGRMG